jgi:predicted RNA-binding protein with TRAM domain
MSYTNRNVGFRTYRFNNRSPVELGKTYEVDIIDLSRRGDAGIARIEGFVIFVTDAKPSDHVKIKITKVGRRFATAEMVQIDTELD